MANGEIDAEARQRIHDLIGRCFGKTLRASFWQRPLLSVIDTGTGVAIVEERAGAAYLTKFAVSPEHQGQGAGRALWEAVIAEHPALFWRCRMSNPALNFYVEHCDHMSLAPPTWVVLARGLEITREIVSAATGAPDDFDTDM